MGYLIIPKSRIRGPLPRRALKHSIMVLVMAHPDSHEAPLRGSQHESWPVEAAGVLAINTFDSYSITPSRPLTRARKPSSVCEARRGKTSAASSVLHSRSLALPRHEFGWVIRSSPLLDDNQSVSQSQLALRVQLRQNKTILFYLIWVDNAMEWCFPNQRQRSSREESWEF